VPGGRGSGTFPQTPRAMGGPISLESSCSIERLFILAGATLGNYELAKFPKPAEEGMAAVEYLEYVASEEGGQAALKNHDYKKVEEAVGKLAAEESKLVNLRPR
jgi:hypothetical protein